MGPHSAVGLLSHIPSSRTLRLPARPPRAPQLSPTFPAFLDVAVSPLEANAVALLAQWKVAQNADTLRAALDGLDLSDVSLPTSAAARRGRRGSESRRLFARGRSRH
eukprot:1262784-Prymnesium_polylepis.2